jgi:hypothetical protein
MILPRFFSVALAVQVLIASTAAMDFATDGAHKLENAYIEDCRADQTPHGYYGAFLQPCEFTFRQQFDKLYYAGPEDSCSDEVSRVVGKPVPMNWFFNLTEHFDKGDWDEMSSDDLPEIADTLMLWPDQCVGVTPRCYSIHDPVIHETLFKLFNKDGEMMSRIPDGATHIQVNCQSDAMELSRLVYGFADGFEKSMPTIIAWLTTVILFSLVATLYCCYGCFRLCRGPPRAAMAAPAVVHGHYVPVSDDDTEKQKLMQE